MTMLQSTAIAALKVALTVQMETTVAKHYMYGY